MESGLILTCKNILMAFMKTEKLQKVLATLGIASRRTIETWIAAGRISVNGEVAKLGDRVDQSAKIRIDGKPVVNNQKTRAATKVIMYHKPIGEVCTRSDPENRPTVFEHLPLLKAGRWIAIGRLDINSSGLLLFTNDGELANQLMHPSTEMAIEREYAVRVFGNVADETLTKLKAGVMIDGLIMKFKAIKSIQTHDKNMMNRWFHVTLTEGRNREVRRLFESQNIKTNRLIRIRFGSIKLPRDLPPGETRELTANEITNLSRAKIEHYSRK